MLRNLISCSLLAILFGCSSSKPEQEVTSQTTDPGNSPAAASGFLIDTVFQSINFSADPQQSFALYLPPSYNDTAKLPLMIFFDPHGTGSLPIIKYQLLAKHFNYIIAASNNSKNGLPLEQSDQLVANLLNELSSRFSIDDKKISLAGFSGGAKVALSAGEKSEDIFSVIYSGSALPLSHPPPSLSLLGFAGVNDMNYTDLTSFDQSLVHNPHLLIEWNGRHEWPDSLVFADAFYWCSFLAMKNAGRKNEVLINEFLEINRNTMNSTEDPLLISATLRKIIFFLDGLKDISPYSKQLISIQNQEAYQSAVADKQRWLEEEQSLKENYIKAFQDKDLNWWNQEITRMKNAKDEKLRPMYDRILGFISLAGFSISTSAIQKDQYDLATKMLAIYKLADPKNPDQPFLQSCLYAKENLNDKAIASLSEAVKLGLNDKQRILNEPSLQPLDSSAEFQKIIGELK